MGIGNQERGTGRSTGTRSIFRIRRPVLCLSVSILLGSLWGCSASPKFNVLLVSVDCLRADRLNVSGYDARVTTPYLDRLSGEGYRFANAFSNSPWTIPSHASMLTSLYPSTLGFDLQVTAFGTDPPSLSPRLKTLAEILLSAGYSTAAFTDGGPLDPKYGFGRGFQTFVRLESGFQGDVEELSRRADGWIESATEPFFIFFHTYELHLPHTHLTPEESEGHSDASLLSLGYDRDLAYTDSRLGEILLKRLEQPGIVDRTIIVVTSDHGEALNDRVIDSRGKDHGYHLYDELLRVPLLFRVPGFEARASAVEAPVELIDVVPTVLSLVGMKGREFPLQGQDLSPIFHGGAVDPKPLLAEAPFQGPGWGSVRLDGLKLIVSPGIDYEIGDEQWWSKLSFPEEMLFDLAADPGETRNIATSYPREAARMKRLLEGMWEANAEIRRVLGQSSRGPLDPKLLERLRSLGYIQ